MSGKDIEYLSSASDYSMADEWYQFVSCDHFWMRWRFESICRFLTNDWAWGKVLDIGCGNGVVREQISNKYKCMIAGCDLNVIALQQASEKPGPLYFYNIREKRQELKESFNTILLLDVLEHIKDPLLFLDSAGFHLKINGKIIINVPAHGLLYSKYDRIQGHVKRYTLKKLKKELYLSGFCIEKATYWGMSLLPILLLRKFILFFCEEKEVMKKGFNPSSRIVDLILQLFRRIECAICVHPPIGTSLLVIAKKQL